jgi:sulfite exporter TauE/SafE
MGIAGSLHCAGMCSPLAMTVTKLSSSVVSGRIFYNLGRITMYGLLGAIVASMGYMLPISRFQNLLSVSLGLTLIIMAGVGITGIQIPFVTNALIKFTGLLKSKFAQFLHRKNPGSLVLLGSLNGLLPCGLTFLALSFCITLTTPMEGFAYMFLFGIGTLPVMLGFVSIVDLIRNKMNWNMKHLTTGLMLLSGILLVARVFLMHAPVGHSHEQDFVDIVICR